MNLTPSLGPRIYSRGFLPRGLQAWEPPACSLTHRAHTQEGFLGSSSTRAGDPGRLGQPSLRGSLWAGERDKDGWQFRKVRASELKVFHLIALLGDAAFLNQIRPQQPAQNSVVGFLRGVAPLDPK